MSRMVAIAALFGSLVTSAAAESFVLCTSAEKPEIVLEIDARRFEERVISCLSGGGFVTDMTPCAPDDGFGLSAPTGAPVLVDVVDRWQDYGNHLGGVASFHSSPSSYSFTGGFMGPETGYRDWWRFGVSRLTGRGELEVLQEVEEGGEEGWSLDVYNCAAMERKF